MSPARGLLLVLAVVTGVALLDAAFGGWRSVSWTTVIGLTALGAVVVVIAGLRKGRARTDDSVG